MFSPETSSLLDSSTFLEYMGLEFSIDDQTIQTSGSTDSTSPSNESFSIMDVDIPNSDYIFDLSYPLSEVPEELQILSFLSSDEEKPQEALQTLQLAKQSKKIKKNKEKKYSKKKKTQEKEKKPPKFVRNVWTKEEDNKVLQLIEKYGFKWTKIGRLIGGKAGKQVRDRYMNTLRPGIKGEDWDEEEDKLLYILMTKMGQKWAQIAAELPGRTENQVKNRYYSMKKNKNRRKPRTKTSLKKQFELNAAVLEESDASYHQLTPVKENVSPYTMGNGDIQDENMNGNWNENDEGNQNMDEIFYGDNDVDRFFQFDREIRDMLGGLSPNFS